jgi:hypothetical protein
MYLELIIADVWMKWHERKSEFEGCSLYKIVKEDDMWGLHLD